MTIALRLSGGASNTNPSSSLGGAMSSAPATIGLFGPISALQFSTGVTFYRCVYVMALDSPKSAVKAWIASDTPAAQTTVALGWGAAVKNVTEASVANGTTAPAGVTFSSPASQGAAPSGGDLTVGQWRALWIRYTVTSVPLIPEEPFTISISGSTVPGTDITTLGVTTSGDQAANIEAAIASVSVGTVLFFPPGTYNHSRPISITKGVTLMGIPGATLHCTNNVNMAILLRANNTVIDGFNLTCALGVREMHLESGRIVIDHVSGCKVRNNIVDGAGSTGIFMYGASFYEIQNNTVKNTLADSIHNTNQSNNGQIWENQIINSWDDGIAVVSYGGDTGISHTIWAHHNNINGVLHGRGMTVVGGNNITYEDNTINDVRAAAGMLVARETSYNTYGTSGVIFRRNTISAVQTGALVAGTSRTTHGAIEIHVLGATSIYGHANLLIHQNNISNCRYDGMRMFEEKAGMITGATITNNNVTNAGQEWGSEYSLNIAAAFTQSGNT